MSGEGLHQKCRKRRPNDPQDAAQKKAKVNEILSHEKMVYSIVVYKKTPTDDQVKKDIKCKN